MKTHIVMLFTLASLVLVGCSSQPDYRKAEGSGYGYQETKISDTQYRVSFKARGSDKTKAMDYALLRAAEVTLENGYDWFVVTHRETLIDRERVSPESSIGYTSSNDMVTRCGLISCTTTHYPRDTFSAGVHIGGRKSSEIESIVEIKIGKGTRPDTDYSFNALEVKENLSPKN
ncbi:hypothetical protein LG272_02715 [Pseudidiomarina marina]|uniref:CC0125/CC1285 family lipoprotein n=1 Tax=Pseudidiomarina marina TaxID=502366 RepID=UPI00384B01A4